MRRWPPLDSKVLFGSSGDAAGDSAAPPPEGALLAVVLNYTLPPCTPAVWRAARLRVAADGGVNRLYDELPALLPDTPAEEARTVHTAPHCC